MLAPTRMFEIYARHDFAETLKLHRMLKWLEFVIRSGYMRAPLDRDEQSRWDDDGGRH